MMSVCNCIVDGLCILIYLAAKCCVWSKTNILLRQNHGITSFKIKWIQTGHAKADWKIQANHDSKSTSNITVINPHVVASQRGCFVIINDTNTAIINNTFHYKLSNSNREKITTPLVTSFDQESGSALCHPFVHGGMLINSSNSFTWTSQHFHCKI